MSAPATPTPSSTTSTGAPAPGLPEGSTALRWAFLVALVPWALLTWRFDFLCDDAYISFRYARHWAEGKGLVFNLGAEPPVEGYSEFLWVVLMGLGIKLGASVEVLSRLLSAASGALLVVWLVRYLARRVVSAPAALYGAALFAGCLPPLAVWSTGGMGTMPFILALFWLYERLLGSRDEQHGAQAALAACLVVLLRAEGSLWVALVCGLGLLFGRIRRDSGLFRASLLAAGVSLAVFLLQTGFRIAYYEDWMPNTARAKVGVSAFTLQRGASYVGHFLLTFPGVLVALLVPLTIGRRLLRGPALVPFWIVLACLGYAVWVGGDFMCFGRFLLPALPFAAVLLATGLQALGENGRRVPVLAIAALCAVLDLLPAFDLHLAPEAARSALTFRFNFNSPDEDELPPFQSELAMWGDMKRRAAHWRMLGQALGEYTKPGESLVVGAVGAVAWGNELFIYDQHGLVTREVAALPSAPGRRSPGHDKLAPEGFFLDRDPTYVRALLWPKKLPPPPFLERGRDQAIPLDPNEGYREDTVLLLVRPPERRQD